MNTKEKQGIWSILLAMAIVILVSCSKNNIEGIGETATSFATIYAEMGKPYYLIPDSGGATMYITKTSVSKHELTHKRRVVATYTLLKNVTPQNLMDHSFWNVRLDHIMELTCKAPILKSQTEDPNQLGTGILDIKYILFTGEYLSVVYEHVGISSDINLWFDDTNHPASDTWVTSLCLNAPATVTEDKTNGYISFDLSKLFQETRDSRYESGVNDWNPSKLILSYYESANKQKELRFVISYMEYGPSLIPEHLL